MNVTPLAPQTAKDWALLTPGWRCLDVAHRDGTAERYGGPRACYDALDALGDAGTVLYAGGNLTHLRHTTGASAWEADVWRGRATAMRLAGTKARVTSLRGTLEGPEPAAELARAMAWLESCGVAAAGLSTMAWALWRRSLAKSVAITSHPSVGRAAFYGGRQEIRGHGPGLYRHMVCADITAAYATSMVARPYGLRLRRVDSSTELDAAVAGLAEAVVHVDADMPFAPLPLRLGPEMITFPTGRVAGLWPWCELAAAKALGCSVKVGRCWAPATEAEPFARWWSWVQDGRALGGGAGRLAKAIANSTWGLFAMAGDDRSVVRWTDDTGDRSVTVTLKPLAAMEQRHTAHLAAETTARVRVRILTEALYSDAAAPVHIDTDGIVVRKSAPIPAGDGGPGEWRVKTAMSRCEIRAPQCYRYKCAGTCPACLGPDWHYVTAGMGPDAARGVFERIGKGVPFAFTGIDYVMPSRNTLERDATRADAYAARGVVAAAFGPGLGSI